MQILGKLDKKCYVGCSGGKDSMTLLHFLLKGRREVEVLHVNHNTEHGREAERFVRSFCFSHSIPFHTVQYEGVKQTEQAWRDFRYSFFSRFKDYPIYLAHTLQDNIETYIMADIKGTAKFIPYQRDNIIRPMLLTFNSEIDRYVEKNKVVWIEDPSNSTSNYDRNKIRNEVIPVLKQINPGLEKTFFKRCIEKYKKDGII